MNLAAAQGTLSVEWMNPADGATTPGEGLSGGGRRVLRSPYSSDAVLCIQRSQR